VAAFLLIIEIVELIYLKSKFCFSPAIAAARSLTQSYRIHTSLSALFGALENTSLFNVVGHPLRLALSTERVI